MLPPAVDLRPWYPPIMDQGDLGTCVENGGTGALRWHIRKMAGKSDDPLSRLYAYFRVRELEGTIDEDAGGEIRNFIKIVKKFGIPHEVDWPYDVAKFKQSPPSGLEDRTQLFGSLQYERVPVTAHDLKAALAGGFPVVIGITLFDSFESDAVEKTGLVPMPEPNEEEVGGHCMCAVGYGQKPGTFTVANSWSWDWGDKGFCFIPEAYLGSSKYGSDYWVIKNVVAA